jgi:RNA polymerase sigma factor (sigma-70 family)
MTTAQTGLVLQHIRRLAGARSAVQPPDAHLLERFTAAHDDAAFAALVRRHGPMVLNVCRSILRHEHDAEDAFQATFLILARKAAAVRKPDALAGWLYEVAYHAALKARSDAARRRIQEQKALPLASVDPTLDMTLRDLHRVLHEELRQLPDKYRVPLVLCYLEGQSQGQAAKQLGWSEGSFRGRLDRGRERLRRRLARRGVALSALLCATAVAPRAAAEALVDSVVRAAGPSALDGTTLGVLSARVSALAEGVTRAMFLSKLRIITAMLLLVSLVTGAGALAAREGAKSHEAATDDAKPSAATVKPPAMDEKEDIVYRGRVLGPDGQPVAGAKLYVTLAVGYLHWPEPSPEYGTTGPDGRFQFMVPKAKFGDEWTVVTAAGAKHGPGWVQVPESGARDNLTLRLVDDNEPVTGQIVDLEGKPIPGVTLTVMQINAAAREDLGPWLEAVKNKKGLSYQLEHQYLKGYTIALCPKVTTDAAGRFRLTGIGRNRLVLAQLDGPTIVSEQLCILTRPGKTIEVTSVEGKPEYGERPRVTTYLGASFRHVVAPSRPIVGGVCDKDTKKPLSGAMIQSYTRRLGPGRFGQFDIVRTRTDTEGRYRLTGMPKGEGYQIVAIPTNDQPYVAVQAEVPDSPGLDPVTVDFALKRGIWIEGKLTDKVTGKPLQGSVEYFSMYNNPNRADYPGSDGVIVYRFFRAKADGTFRAVGLPGPGLIGVYYQRDSYLRADEREDEYGAREHSLETSPYHISFTSNYSAIARINPAKGVDSVKRDVTLDPGWKFTATVLGPDGNPLAGTRSFDLNRRNSWQRERLKTAEFTGWFNPRRPYEILFHHPEKGLVGLAQPPKDNDGSVTVRLEPGAAVTGRLVDADGKPRAGVELVVTFLPKGWGSRRDYSPEPIKADREGRFRIEALLPGRAFRLSDGPGELPFGEDLRSGETRDLGDIQVKPTQKRE